MRVLVIDAIGGEAGKAITDKIESAVSAHVIRTENMRISPCIGCNNCWLKTPGVCSVKDDYEQILKAYLRYDTVLYVGNTALGFIDYRLKNIIDRVLPLVTMLIHFVDGQERHVVRYEKQFRFGLIYAGDGNRDYLNRWLMRMAVNFQGSSLGAFPAEEVMEAVTCI